jgi:hypothetical protein
VNEQTTGCRSCGRPAEGHGVRYVALFGEHVYTPPRDTRPAHARTEERAEAPEPWSTTPIPHPAGGITYARSPEEYQRHLEDAEPAEAPLPPAPESCHPPDAVNLPIHYANAGLIRRILNATNRKASS